MLSLLVLNLLPETRRTAREMVRVSKPGCTVAAAAWTFWGGFTLPCIRADTVPPVDPEGDTFRAKQLSGPSTAPGGPATVWMEACLLQVGQTSPAIRMKFTCDGRPVRGRARGTGQS